MEERELKAMIDEDELKTNAKIKVIGVGGGGSNAVNQMIHDKEEQVEYWVFNTDNQALSNSPCPNKLVLGRNVTKGLGAGGNPEMGKKAAEDSYEDIKLVVKGCDMVFIAVGEGGGTGTGAAPVVARASREEGCLVLAIVTRPFNFEGKLRKLNALEGINELIKNVDALIVVSNDRLMFSSGGQSIKNAFAVSDRTLADSVSTVTDLILLHGIINLDFADVKSTLQGKGLSLIGIGMGKGENKAIEAATNAINSPLLEASIKGSRSMIINVTVGEDVTLDDVQHAIDYITEAAGADKDNGVNIIFGVQMNASFQDEMKIAIIATDFAKEIELNLPTTNLTRSTRTYIVDKTREETPAYVKPLAEGESRVEKEIKAEEENSVLPDYLKTLFAREGERNEHPSDTEKEEDTK